MSKPEYIRKIFNAGEIAPEIQNRTDLKAFHYGCNKVRNADVTPYGTVKKRFGTKFLSQVNDSLYGIPIKYIPFKFSATEIFHLVFTDASGTDTSTFQNAALLIFDSNGNLVRQQAEQSRTTTARFVEETPYLAEDIDLLHFIQVKDYIFLTCGGKYPVKTINRRYYATENINYFYIENHVFDLPPFQDQNVDRSLTMTTSTASATNADTTRFKGVYNSATTYSVGDLVTPEQITIPILQLQIILTGANCTYDTDTVRRGRSSSTTYTRLINNLFYSIKIRSSVARPAEGTNIYLENITAINPEGYRQDLTGPYEVTYNPSYGTNNLGAEQHGYTFYLTKKFEVQHFSDRASDNNMTSDTALFEWARTHRSAAWGGAFSLSITGSMSYSLTQYTGLGTYYCSNTDSNTGNALTDTTNWNPGQYPSDSVLTARGETQDDYAAVATGTISTTDNLFLAGCEGEFIRVEKEFTGITKTYDMNGQSAGTVDESATFSAHGQVILTTEGGAWSGKLFLMESTDNGSTFDIIGTIISENYTSNGSLERTIFNPRSILKVRFEVGTNISGNDDINITNENKVIYKVNAIGPHYSYYEITERVSDNLVKVSSIGNVEDHTDTHKWSFSSFSDRSGYPNTLCIHDERLILGGTTKQPTTIFGSRTNGWSDYTLGDQPNDPYIFTLNSDTFDMIRSLRSSSKLMVFTENSEVTVGASGENAVISSTNIDVNTETKYGSSQIQSLVTADLAFFVQGENRRVRTTQFDFVSDRFLSSEVSLFSHHITSPGIKEMTFVRNPYSKLYFVLTDGSMAVFTYEKDQQVKGWAKFFLGSTAASSKATAEIISIGGQFSDEGDYLVMLTKRPDSDGTNFSYNIETLAEENISFNPTINYTTYNPAVGTNEWSGSNSTAYKYYGTDSTNTDATRQGTGYFYPVYTESKIQLASMIYNGESTSGVEGIPATVEPMSEWTTIGSTTLEELADPVDDTNNVTDGILVETTVDSGFSSLFRINNTDSENQAFDVMKQIYENPAKNGFLQFSAYINHTDLAAKGVTFIRVGCQLIMAKSGSTYPNAPVQGKFNFNTLRKTIDSSLAIEKVTFVIPFNQNLDDGTTNSINDGFAANCTNLQISLNTSTNSSSTSGGLIYFDNFYVTHSWNMHNHVFTNDPSTTYYMPNYSTGLAHALPVADLTESNDALYLTHPNSETY